MRHRVIPHRASCGARPSRGLLAVSLVLGACGGSGGAGGRASTAPDHGPTAESPAMRYVQDGAPLGVLGTDGRVTLEGGEHVATLHANGQVVDHAGTPIFGVTSSGRIVFSSITRDPMALTDGVLAFAPGAELSIDDGGNFRMGEEIVGVFVEGFRPEATEAAFLGWLALTFATIPFRRSLAAEARQSLEAMYALLSDYVGREGRLPSASPTTPSEVPCGAPSPWPSDVSGGLREIGFAPERDVHYAYGIDVTGSEFVLRARADLDCDGTFGRFELHGRRTAEGVTREPLLRVIDELE